MFRDKLRFSVLLADLLWILAAWLLAFAARTNGLGAQTMPDASIISYRGLLLASMILWSVLHLWAHSNALARSWRIPSLLSWLSVWVLILGLFCKLGAYILSMHLPWRGLGLFALFVYTGTAAIRLSALGSFGIRGTMRRTAILGNERVARELAASFLRNPEMRTEVVGMFSPAGQNGADPSYDRSRRISTIDIIDVLVEKNVTDLVVALSHSVSRQVAQLVPRCQDAGIKVSVVPRFYDLYITRPQLVEVGGIPLLRMEPQSEDPPLLRLKPVIDVLLAIVLLSLSAPLLALAAVYLKLCKGRVLKTEQRCGRNGRLFQMYSLAVNRGDAEDSWLPRAMSQISLTELPQLWNVLRGEMSVVGPRPETPERLKHYSDWHRQRLRVKPGITGLAQVEGVRDESSSDEKNRFDLQYMLGWSPLLDVALVLQTCWTVVNRLRTSQDTSRGTTPEDRQEHIRFTPMGMVDNHANSAQSGAD